MVEDAYATPPKEAARTIYSLIKDEDWLLWIGSGVSQLTHLSWSDLIVLLCTECDPVDSPKVAELEPAELIEKAQEVKDACESRYHQTLIREFDQHVPQQHRTAALRLMRLPFSGYLTTNFDTSLSDAAEHTVGRYEVFYYPDKLQLRFGHPDPQIYYLHGHPRGISNGETNFVLARSEFDQAYADDSKLRPVLEYVLKCERILFVGCELKEPAVQAQFERISHLMSSEDLPDRYILLPHRFRQSIAEDSPEGKGHPNKELEAEENERFESIGIEVLRYDPVSKDHEGFDMVFEEIFQLSHTAREARAARDAATVSVGMDMPGR